MPNLSTDERLAFLAGQVHALIAFALALAESHPDRELLRQKFESSVQGSLARLETALNSDRSVDAFQDIAKKIRSMLGEKQQENH